MKLLNINNFSLKSSNIGKTLITSFYDNLFNPIDRKITGQDQLIKTIESDMNKTVQDQKTTRKHLSDKMVKIKLIAKEYVELNNNIIKEFNL